MLDDDDDKKDDKLIVNKTESEIKKEKENLVNSYIPDNVIPINDLRNIILGYTDPCENICNSDDLGNIVKYNCLCTEIFVKEFLRIPLIYPSLSG